MLDPDEGDARRTGRRDDGELPCTGADIEQSRYTELVEHLRRASRDTHGRPVQRRYSSERQREERFVEVTIGQLVASMPQHMTQGRPSRQDFAGAHDGPHRKTRAALAHAESVVRGVNVSWFGGARGVIRT